MYRKRSIFPLLNTNNFSVDEIREKFVKRTFSRSELIGFINMNTIEGANNFPCNTFSGLTPGAPCSFPFVIPDCRLAVKARGCGSNPKQTLPVSYEKCNKNSICFTRTYENNSAILGQWGDCNANCNASLRWKIFQQRSHRVSENIAECQTLSTPWPALSTTETGTRESSGWANWAVVTVTPLIQTIIHPRELRVNSMLS